MRKIVRVTLKTMAALFAIGAVLMVFGVWRLAVQPIDSHNFTPYVEMGFTFLLPGTRAEVKETKLSWDNAHHTLNLSCTGVDFLGRAGSKVASFPSIQLKYNIWNLLRGRMLPLEMKSEEARFWLTRNRAGSLSLGGHDEEGRALEGIDLFPFLEDMGYELSHESLRQQIDIKNVKLILQDMRSATRATLRIPEIVLNHDARESVGQAKIELMEQDNPIYVEAKYSFDFDKKQHHASMSFQDIRPAALAREDLKLNILSVVDFPLSGQLAIVTDRDLHIVDAVIDVEGGDGIVTYPDLWDVPRTVKKSHIKGGFDRDKNVWALRDVFVDFGGTTLTMKAEAKAPFKKSETWRHPRQNYGYWAKIAMTNLPLDQFGAFWPKTIIPNPRKWIMNHMSKGRFTKGVITLHGSIDWDDLENSTLDTGEGEIEARGGTVLYMDGMPPVHDVDAVARYTLKKMDVDVLKGRSEDLVVRPFTIKMSDFDKDIQKIIIPAKLAGPTRTIIRRLKGPPLGYADELGLDPEDMGGKAEGTITLSMPLLADLYLKDITVKADAKIHSFSSKKLVEGFPIEEGEVAFHLGDDGFTVKGPISLRKLPLQLSWRTSFNKSVHIKEPLHQAMLIGPISGEQWDASGILPQLKYKGVAPITIHYAQTEDGYSTVDVEAGFSRADVTLDYLNWKKPVGLDADVKLSIEVADHDVLKFSQIVLRGEKLDIQGSGELDLKTGQFTTLRMSPYVIGRSNAAVTLLKPLKAGGDSQVLVKGKSFDAMGILDDTPEETDSSVAADTTVGQNKPQSFDISTTTLFLSESGFLRNAHFTGRRDELGWDVLSLDGVAQDKTPLSISVKKEGHIRKLNIVTGDFGSAMHGLGLTESVQGGELVVTGQSTPEDPRKIDGDLKVTSFKVSDAPFLARLFSAISPFGFADLITGDSSFNRMKAKFTLKASDLTLHELQAPGSVAGINMKGKIDLDTGNANLAGTVVPFSFVNSILESIPLLGDVITGGNGQGIIAASFKIQGQLSTADINVNPVSLLTPGFLRNLFFGGEPTEDVPQDEKAIKEKTLTKQSSNFKTKGKK